MTKGNGAQFTTFWLMFVLGLLAVIVAIIALLIALIRRKGRWLWANIAFYSLIFMTAGIAMGTYVDISSWGTGSSSGTPVSTKTTVPPAETLEQILGRAANISSVRFDMISTTGGESSKGTGYWNGNRSRLDIDAGGQLGVVLQFSDNHTRIVYVPESKQGQQESLTSDNEIDISPVRFAKQVQKQAGSVLGPDIIDDLATLLVEGIDESGNRCRTWVEREHGFPVRIEVWTTEGKSTTEIKNLEFSYLPDVIFEVPPDIKMTTVPPAPTTPSPATTKPATTPTPIALPVTVPRLYVNPNIRYSVEALEGWTIEDNDKSNVIIRSPDRAAYVQIFGRNSDVTLETALKNIVANRSTSSNFQELSRSKGLLPGSLPAWSLGAKWSVGSDASIGRKLWVITVKDNRQIEIIGSATDNVFDKYSAQLQQIVYSLAMAD